MSREIFPVSSHSGSRGPGYNARLPQTEGNAEAMDPPCELLIAEKMRDLDFGKLMKLYRAYNARYGAEAAPDKAEAEQLFFAENQFREFLTDNFFSQNGAGYFIRVWNGRYASALRLWRYQDGFLIEGLETDPDFRRMGHATHLIRAVQERTPLETRLYAHVHKRNRASLSLHKKADFQMYLDFARGIFGDVSSEFVTLVWIKRG